LVKRQPPTVIARSLELRPRDCEDCAGVLLTFALPLADGTALLLSLDGAPETSGPYNFPAPGGRARQQRQRVHRYLPFTDTVA
jgi:hypothetical protein